MLQFLNRELPKAVVNLGPKRTTEIRNPFLPFLNPRTQRWRPPAYSRRRQAELIKAARMTNMMHLLPPGPKMGPKEIPRGQGVGLQWVGEVQDRPVPGADYGSRLYAGKKRMFKGHKWERMEAKRRGQIKVRLRDMPKRIATFKNHYRRRRPYPLGPATPRKKESLPF